ncbi:MAG: hypothetical protein KKF30_03735 [Proteobacteria bacterium]|nr:hypothetical protein [Pseudomonadota bacterium]MBU4471873.1 hypothetical protein [Pseudomonadota bacterium]MCG2751155.1 hypothetical protein [Desulfobacteraceae bacterium]
MEFWAILSVWLGNVKFIFWVASKSSSLTLSASLDGFYTLPVKSVSDKKARHGHRLRYDRSALIEFYHAWENEFRERGKFCEILLLFFFFFFCQAAEAAAEALQLRVRMFRAIHPPA